jgi:hypothetical protein
LNHGGTVARRFTVINCTVNLRATVPPWFKKRIKQQLQNSHRMDF